MTNFFLREVRFICWVKFLLTVSHDVLNQNVKNKQNEQGCQHSL